jgi:hypothetical protein
LAAGQGEWLYVDGRAGESISIFQERVVCVFPCSSSSSSSPNLEPEEEFVREKKRSSHIIDGVLTD